MPAWVSASSFIRAGIPPACSSARLVGWPISAALSSAKTNWAYAGCSVHSVPSLSNTATRSRSGTKSADSASVTAATNSIIACFAVVSRQLGSSSLLMANSPTPRVDRPQSARPRQRRNVSMQASHPVGMTLFRWPRVSRHAPLQTGVARSVGIDVHALVLSRPDDAAEAEVGCTRIDRLRHPRRWAVAAAVVRRAQVRAALHRFAGNAGVGQLGIVTSLPVPTPGAVDGAAGMRGLRMRLVPVPGPLPDVADHVVQPVAVGWERAHRCGPLVPVLLEVPDRKFTLPGVGHPGAARGELVTPRELGAVQAAAGGELPLGLGRQLLTGPPRVRLDVVPGDVHHRMVRSLLDRTAWPLRVAPVGSGHVDPPLVVVAQVDAVSRRPEHGRRRQQQFWVRARVVGGVRGLFGDGHIAGLGHEASELAVGDRVLIDPEAVDTDLVSRCL